jgi:hypothetical protein
MRRVDGPFGLLRLTSRYLFRGALVGSMLLAVGQAGPAGASSLHAAGGVVQCEPIKGPEWVFPTDNLNRSDLFGASIQSTLYESFVVNMSCSQAAGFIRTLITQTLPITTPGAINALTAGPGYTCIAYPDKNGHAYAGSCLSGSARFDWNYNVMWHGVPDSSAGEGGLGIEPMGTIEYTTVLRPLGNGHYELVVTNSSAIGSINQFSWAAPPELTITAVTKSTGATCSVAGGGISCQGSLHPPKCLCTGSGGSVTIEFTATGDAETDANGHPVIHGLGWSYLRISQMTPVPYLVPDTPQVANNKSNL